MIKTPEEVVGFLATLDDNSYSRKKYAQIVNEFPELCSTKVLTRLAELREMKTGSQAKSADIGPLTDLILHAIDDIERGFLGHLVPKAKAFYEEYLELMKKHGVQILSETDAQHNNIFIAETGNYPQKVSWHRFDDRFDELLQLRDTQTEDTGTLGKKINGDRRSRGKAEMELACYIMQWAKDNKLSEDKTAKHLCRLASSIL